MTWQTSAPLEPLNVSITARAALGLVDEMTSGQLTVDLPYQRGHVWSTSQQVELVRSWMTGTPIPALIINDRLHPGWGPTGDIPDGQPVAAVIDGKQRLLTAHAWFTGDLMVPVSWFPPAAVEHFSDTRDGPYVAYPGLARRDRLSCARSWHLPVGTARVGTVQEEAALYLRVNGSGTPQAPEDMARAARVAGTDGGVI